MLITAQFSLPDFPTNHTFSYSIFLNHHFTQQKLWKTLPLPQSKHWHVNEKHLLELFWIFRSTLTSVTRKGEVVRLWRWQ